MGWKFGSWISAALSLLVAAACDGGGTQFLHRDQRDSIKIGVKADQPGTGWAPDGYHFSGFDIKVAEKMVKELKFNHTLVSVPSGEREVRLLSKGRDLDLVIATYSITEPRALQGIFFVGPYAKTYQGFMIQKNEYPKNGKWDYRGK
ncbi:MAG: transporter substrate-binding domain-containing protein, partial [Acidimicrobiia bacterium]